MADLEGLNMYQLRARLDAGTNARREALHHAGAAYADVSAAAERQRLRMTVERQMRGTERLQEVTRQTLRKRERIDRDELYADIGSTAVPQKSLDNKELETYAWTREETDTTCECASPRPHRHRRRGTWTARAPQAP